MIDILLGAIVFSMLNMALFYKKTIGLSMLLFVVPFTLFIIKILEKRHDNLNKNAKFLLLPITLLAITYFIFDNMLFNTLNLIVIPILIAIMILILFNEKIDINIEIVKKVVKILALPLIYIGDTFRGIKSCLKHDNNDEIINKEKNGIVKKIIKSIFITLPLVLFIIGLLSTADYDFARLFSKIVISIIRFLNNLSLSEFFERLITLIVVFVYFICLFYYLTNIYRVENKRTKSKQKDNFTIKIVLGVLNIIYLIFCYLQVKSLIVNNSNINYANYARRGFFQLMIVSIINLITILIAKNKEKTDATKGNKYIKVMSLTMIFFTFIILISAVIRMNAYENAYGYTILRLLVYFVFLTEAMILIPTILYVLDKNINLPKIYFSIILSVYILMNFINFDRIIAKRNVDRFFEIGKIDMMYIQNNLGTGAVNEVIRLIDKNQDAQFLLKNIYNTLEKEKMDFRDLNISKIIAREILKKNIENIQNQERNSIEDNTVNEPIYNNFNNEIQNMQNNSYITNEIEEFYGVVKNKTENTIEISYTSDKYETILKRIIVTDSDKNRIDIGDWVSGQGKFTEGIDKIKIIYADNINVTSRQIYQDEILKSLYNKTKLWTSVSYIYESEGGGDGYIICPVYFSDDSKEISGYVKVLFDQDTQAFLGRKEQPVQTRYEIILNEMVEITFKSPVININKLEAKTLEFIAD